MSKKHWSAPYRIGTEVIRKQVP